MKDCDILKQSLHWDLLQEYIYVFWGSKKSVKSTDKFNLFFFLCFNYSSVSFLSFEKTASLQYSIGPLALEFFSVKLSHRKES